MKEHAGGSIPDGLMRVPLEWSEDRAFAVPIEQFPYESLDENNLAGILKDELHFGGDVAGFFNRYLKAKIDAERADIVRQVLGLVIHHQRPDLAVFELAFACGLLETAELTQPALGKKYGVTKEAIQQGVEKFRRELGLRKTRTMRGMAERHRMRLCNYRKLPIA